MKQFFVCLFFDFESNVHRREFLAKLADACSWPLVMTKEPHLRFACGTLLLAWNFETPRRAALTLISGDEEAEELSRRTTQICRRLAEGADQPVTVFELPLGYLGQDSSIKWNR